MLVITDHDYGLTVRIVFNSSVKTAINASKQLETN